jgi:hypothetical protein
MKTLGLLLLTAPIGYIVLTGYLLGKTRPIPVGLLSSGFASPDRELEALAA